MSSVYLDYAATAPLRPQAREAMVQAMDFFGNPSSVHTFGQHARHQLDTARRTTAEALGTRAERVIFTSGGTEANNLALRGITAQNIGKTILISALEHDCIRQTAFSLAHSGHIKIEEIPAEITGLIDLPWLENRLKQGGVALVSLMHANNETGIIQPLAEATKIAHAHNVPIHTDAVQTVGHLPIDFEAMGVDMLTFSAHKFGGPKGAGALLVKPELKLTAHITGGAQERNRRAGTENAVAICGLAAALATATSNMAAETAHASTLASLLETNLPLSLSIIAASSPKVPHIRQLHTPGYKGEDSVIALDIQGVATSQGAACSSGKVQSSHVLQAMGYSSAAAAEGLRLSWGWATQEAELHAALKALQTLVK
jgi:cysteine desulfurase